MIGGLQQAKCPIYKSWDKALSDADMMAARWRGGVDIEHPDGAWARNIDPDKAVEEVQHWVSVSDTAAKRMDLHLQTCKECNVMAEEPKFKYGDLVVVAGLGTTGRVVNVSPPGAQSMAFQYQVSGPGGFSFCAEHDLVLSDDMLQRLIFEMYGEARKYRGATQGKELKRGLRIEMKIYQKDDGSEAYMFGMRISRAVDSDAKPSRAEWDTCFARLPVAYDADQQPKSFVAGGRNIMSRTWDYLTGIDDE